MAEQDLLSFTGPNGTKRNGMSREKEEETPTREANTGRSEFSNRVAIVMRAISNVNYVIQRSSCTQNVSSVKLHVV